MNSLYIGDVKEEKLINGALEGYVSALGDEYTEYLTESEIEELMQEVNGSYVGVGLYIAQVTDSNEILVVGIIKDSPAEKAGIHAGDVVKKDMENVLFLKTSVSSIEVVRVFVVIRLWIRLVILSESKRLLMKTKS